MDQEFPRYLFVKSLKKGLAILEAFSPQKPRLTTSEITKKTKLPKATTFRLLHTLMSLGYVLYDTESKYYYVGPQAMALGYAALASMDLRESALPYMRELSRITGQNINLGILDGIEVVYIERIRKWEVVNINLHVGSRVSAYRTAVGRAILAFLSPEEFRGVMDRIKQDPEAERYVRGQGGPLIGMLEEVRRKGYALSDEEAFKNIRAIGAPIFGDKQNVEGAISLPVMAHSTSRKELIERYVPVLLSSAKKISMIRGCIKK